MEPSSDVEWNEEMKGLLGDDVFDGGNVLAIENSSGILYLKRFEYTRYKRGTYTYEKESKRRRERSFGDERKRVSQFIRYNGSCVGD